MVESLHDNVPGDRVIQMRRKILALLVILILIGFTTIALGLHTSSKESDNKKINGEKEHDVVKINEDNKSDHVYSSEDNEPDNNKPRETPPLTAGSLSTKPGVITNSNGITVDALKGAEVTDIYISYSDANLTLADRVKIDAFYSNGTKKFTENYRNVAIINRTSLISSTNLNQNETIAVLVEIGSGKSVLKMTAQTRVKLRPDLAIQSINAPSRVLSGSPFDVDLNTIEINRDTGANFSITIKEGTNVVTSTSASIIPGGNTLIKIPLLIQQTGLHNLSAVIENSDPSEYSTLNNQQDISVEIIRRPDLAIQNLTAPSAVLSGDQFDVDLNITELNNDSGADFTVLIKEGGSILASNTSSVSAGSRITVPVQLVINQTGLHNLSAIIIDAVPAEDPSSISNNRQDFSIEIVQPVQSPDIAIQNISSPNTALSGSYINVNVTLTELGGVSGASFNTVIKEAGTILGNASSSITPGGSTEVTISLLITQAGIHNLTVTVQDSIPIENNVGNNQQNFTVEITRPALNPVGYTSKYYSQTDDYHNSKNVNSAADGGTHIEVSVYNEKKISERFNYTSTINQALVFPIDYLHIRLSNGANVAEEHALSNIASSGSSTAFVYYPETDSTLTITVSGGTTAVKLERKAKLQTVQSSGYNYYSAVDNSSWNTNFANQTGILMNPALNTTVYLELIDGGTGYGGTETMNPAAPVYSNTTWNNAGVTGYRNIAWYYPIQTGTTS